MSGMSLIPDERRVGEVEDTFADRAVVGVGGGLVPDRVWFEAHTGVSEMALLVFTQEQARLLAHTLMEAASRTTVGRRG